MTRWDLQQWLKRAEAERDKSAEILKTFPRGMEPTRAKARAEGQIEVLRAVLETMR